MLLIYSKTHSEQHRIKTKPVEDDTPPHDSYAVVWVEKLERWTRISGFKQDTTTSQQSKTPFLLDWGAKLP